MLRTLATDEAWAYTRWRYDGREPVVFEWRLPRCETIWALDAFREGWNAAIMSDAEDASVYNPHSSAGDEALVAALALRWISAGTTVQDESASGLELSWPKVREHLEALTASADGRTGMKAAHWICSVCAMLMPEMGIMPLLKNQRAGASAEAILTSPKIASVCRKNRYILHTQRARRLGALLAADNEHLYRTFDELTPDLHNGLFRVSEAMVYRAVNREAPRRPRRTPVMEHESVLLSQRMRAARRKQN